MLPLKPKHTTLVPCVLQIGPSSLYLIIEFQNTYYLTMNPEFPAEIFGQEAAAAEKKRTYLTMNPEFPAEIFGQEAAAAKKKRAYLTMNPEFPAEIFGQEAAAAEKKRAYVTFLAGCGDYVKGVVGLAKGLRKVKSEYPLVVAVLADVPEDHRLQLRRQGCIVRQIQPIDPPDNEVIFSMPYYVLNYSKLRIWEFEEYSKMVYLDADIQVFDNIDNLFDMRDGYFYAVMDCFCEKTWSHTPQYKIGYCQQCPDKVSWPIELGRRPSPYFNAGMFVFEPNQLTFDCLFETLMATVPTPFAEQDFLNMFFEKIYKPIPLVYNLVLAMLWRHPQNVDLDRVKVVHYCAAGSKPWRFSGKEENMEREDIKTLVQKWWNIYNDSSLDHLGSNDTIPDPISEADGKSNDLQQVVANSFLAARPTCPNLMPAPPAA